MHKGFSFEFPCENSKKIIFLEQESEPKSLMNSPSVRGVLASRRRTGSPVEVLAIWQISRMLEDVGFGHVLRSLYGVLF